MSKVRSVYISESNGVLMTILLQRIKFKKRLMPALFPILLAGCTNLFGSALTAELTRDANAS